MQYLIQVNLGGGHVHWALAKDEDDREHWIHEVAVSRPDWVLTLSPMPTEPVTTLTLTMSGAETPRDPGMGA